MITDFFREKKDITKEWKSAYQVDRAGNRTYFGYFLVPTDEISKIGILSGIFLTKSQMIIMTTSDIEINHTSKIILEDGFQYSFVSETDNNSDNENNVYGIPGSPSKRYITIERPF